MHVWALRKGADVDLDSLPIGHLCVLHEEGCQTESSTRSMSENEMSRAATSKADAGPGDESALCVFPFPLVRRLFPVSPELFEISLAIFWSILGISLESGESHCNKPSSLPTLQIQTPFPMPNLVVLF